MKRLSCCHAIVGGIFLLAGILLAVVPMDQRLVALILRATHVSPSSNTAAVVNGISPGMIMAAFTLLLLSGVFYFSARSSWFARLRSREFLAGLIAVQMILGVICMAAIPTTVVIGDEAWYFQQSERLAQGLNPVWNHGTGTPEHGEYTAFWSIGYPVYLSLFFRLFGAYLPVAQFANLLLLPGIALLFYLLARKVVGELRARQATLVVALLPSALFTIPVVISELLFTLLLLGLLYLALQKTSRANTVMMGLAFGAALATRPTILFLPIIIALYRFKREGRWKPALTQLLVVLALGEIVILPWQVRNYLAFNEFIAFDTHGGWNFWDGNNPLQDGADVTFPKAPWEVHYMKDEAQRDKFMMRLGVKYILDHPWRTLAIWPAKLLTLYSRDSKMLAWSVKATGHLIAPTVLSWLFLVTDGYYLAVMLAFMLALLRLKIPSHLGKDVWLLLGTVIYSTCIYLPFVTDSRYHSGWMPLIILITILGLSRTEAPAPVTSKSHS